MATSVVNLKTGRAILRRIADIEATPVIERRRKWGKGWAWEKVNGATRIREEFPELVEELNALLDAPKTLDDLTPVGHSIGAG